MQASPKEAFALWQRTHGRSYKTPSEATKRLAVFAANARYVAEHNARNSGLVLGLNQFADLTFEEFSASHLGYKQSLRGRWAK
jgi:cathepsin L/KDEL-tailed cysteine endopeptidase